MPHVKKSWYQVPDDILDREYPVLRFMGATKEWLEFVVNNRRGRENGDYDLPPIVILSPFEPIEVIEPLTGLFVTRSV